MRPIRPCLVATVGLGLALTAAAELRAQTTPGAAPTPAVDTAPLARYLPKTDRLFVLVEFDGLDAHADAWKASAASKVLNDTTTGAMLEDLLTQVIDQVQRPQPDAKPSLSGADAVAIAKYLAQQGFLIAVYGDEKTPAGEHGVMVFRGAARKENRPIAARLLGALMGQGAKTQKAVREGRTVVEVTPAVGNKSAWWTEKDSDLVFLERAEDVDAVLATLDGKAPSALESPQRAALYEGDGSFVSLGGAMMDLEVSRQLVPKAAKDLEGVPVRRVDFRVGFDGPALTSITRVDVPAPRQGAWAILDQPLFDFRALPPIPNGVDGFTAFSLDLDKTYGLVTELVRKANPQAATRIDAFEKLVEERTRRKLREDFLAPLGPKLVFYIAPGEKEQKAKPPAERAAQPAPGANPLASLGGIGLQVPKFVLLAETNNPAKFSRALDELIIFVNNQFEKQFAPKPEEDADKKTASSKGTRKSSRSSEKAPDPPRFQMTSVGAAGSAKTYLLRLPTQLAAMTNLNLTIAMGRKHVVIASAADVAREALALESSTEGRWAPPGDLAQALARLPEGRLMMLRVKDPRGTLPEGLANLPQTMTTLSAQLAQAAKGGVPGLPGLTPPGAAGAAQPQPGANPPGSNINRRKLGITGADPLPSNTAAPEGNPGATPGATAPGGAAALGSFHVTLDPAKAPKADQIRPLLFPGASALLVEDRGVRFVTRSSFPDFASPSGAGTTGVMVALLLPAVQSAREAARKATARNAEALAALSLKPGEQNVGRYAVALPADLTPLTLPPTPTPPRGTSVQTKAWSSPKDEQGQSTTIIVAVFSGPDEIKPQLDNFIAGYYNGLKRSLAASGLTDFSEDGRETVDVGGRQFTRLTYSAGPDAQRHVLRGMAYITAEGNEAVTLAGAAPDGQEQAMTAMLQAVAQSFRRGDVTTPGASAPAPAP